MSQNLHYPWTRDCRLPVPLACFAPSLEERKGGGIYPSAETPHQSIDIILLSVDIDQRHRWKRQGKTFLPNFDVKKLTRLEKSLRCLGVD